MQIVSKEYLQTVRKLWHSQLGKTVGFMDEDQWDESTGESRTALETSVVFTFCT